MTTTPEYTDETRPRFVCSHSDRDDRPPTEIPFYLHGRGNGSFAYRDGVAERMKVTIDTSRSLDDGLVDESVVPADFREARAKAEAFAALAEVHADNLSSMNHHQIDCPDCGFTERITGRDVESLLEWSERHAVRDIPLRQARRVLNLLGADGVEG